MLRPAYRLTLGGGRIDAPGAGSGTVTGLVVDLDLDVPLDQATITLARVPGSPAPALDDRVTVELGDVDDGVETVFTGTVTSLFPDVTTTRVVAHSAMRKLLRTRIEESYPVRTAGAVVRDMCGRAGLDTATVQDGVELPGYVADAGRTCYGHARILAGLCGFALYADATGRLVFRRGGGTVHTFSYGEDVIDVRVRAMPRPGDGLSVFGESPADRTGAATALGWLTKTFPAGRAGPTAPGPRVVVGALRGHAGAQTAADAAQTTRDDGALTGQVVGLGRPAVALGDDIRLSSAPDTVQNGTFRVVAVRHRLTARHGWTTAVRFRGGGGAG
jgi:phage protein D